MDFLCRCANKPQLAISLFDSRNKKQLDDAIKSGDVLVMGGGPLMDMACMFMVEYAFAKAKKLHKKTMVLGCGVGPMRKRIYERSLIHIVQKSDIIIFRDETSRQEYNRILGHESTADVSIDPAVIAATFYKANYAQPKTKNDMVVAAVRDFPGVYKISKSIVTDEVNSRVITFLKQMWQYKKPVHLIPMSYFGAGYDDRVFMNHIKNSIGDVTVQNNPLSLCETMEQFAQAALCVGMRFHSVVLQTVLNGNNVILDYTDPSTGKIGNFLRQIGAEKQYTESYAALQTTGNVIPQFSARPFTADQNLIRSFKNTYVNAIRGIGK
jgi:polysaccharide pyruvyl transferase WcaK-like protein